MYAIDTVRFMNIPTVPHREKPVSEISLIGKDTILWAQLESERRLYGNDYEVVFDAPVAKSLHNMIASQIDIRNLRSQQI